MSSTLPMRNSPGCSAVHLIAQCLVIAALTVPTLVPTTARADAPVQESTEARLRRIEGELRALQRKVFPDGAGRTFAPQITPGEDAAPVAPQPSGDAAALADVLSRMDAVEAQLKALTATSEDNQNRLSKLETRVGAVETAQAASAPPQPAAPPPNAAPPAPVQAPPPDPVASSPAAANRAAAVAAIERPSTDDKGEDAYTYGYRLWEAKFLPEAEAVLLDFVQRYPNHKRISYARNLLGRAYLDDNRVRSAEQWFLQNYLADKTADRAPDSLLYLAIALAKDKNDRADVKRACDAISEFRTTYPGEATGRLKGQFDAVTKTVTCH